MSTTNKIIVLLLLNFTIAETNASIQIKEYGSGASQYWIISDDEIDEYSDNLVVFLHGYGASNPACYGGWISSILESGSIVVFPKFQQGLFLPRTVAFQRRVDQNIKSSITEIAREFDHRVREITFVAHSIGGVIASNIADQYGSEDDLSVSGMVLVQPGFKYLKLGKQKKYDYINPNTTVVLITGDKDLAAGNKFAKYLYHQTPQIKRKVLLEHFKSGHGVEKVSSDHKEPISPNLSFDTKNRNLVIRGALVMGKTDQVDQFAYWRLTRLVLVCLNSESEGCGKVLSNQNLMTYMGKWRDDTPIQPMKILLN